MQMMRNGNVNGVDLVQEPVTLRVVFQQLVRLHKTTPPFSIPPINGRYFNVADIFGLLQKTARYTPPWPAISMRTIEFRAERRLVEETPWVRSR